jgi:drug/metabolite transporter (DMT)-like permease
MIGTPAVFGWVMVVGFVMLLPFVVATGVPESVGDNAGWLALSGAVNVAGLLSVYEGLRRGKVGVVSAIASTEGAIAALLAVLAGEAFGLPTGVLLTLIATGVFLASLAPDIDGEGKTLDAAGLAAFAAVCFGVGLYATGRVSGDVPLVWAAFPPKIAGTLAVALPLAVTGRMRLTREATPLVITSGVGEVVGFLSYTWGARHGIGVAAVISSQFAAVAAVGAFFLFRERLGRVQVAGVATILTGVAALSAIRA